MKRLHLLLLPFFTLFLFSCGPYLNKTKTVQVDTIIIKEITLDTVLVQDRPEEKIAQELPVYREQPYRDYDIKHTILDLKFDWEKEYVLGKAYLDISAYALPVKKINLDAVNFDIHTVKMTDVKGEDIAYNYDGKVLSIELNKELRREDKIRVYIDYTAKPAEAESGGSMAIMSDNGLYFINPRGENPRKPQQIWTQGETESNSKWFPTYDKPNERTTQEMYVTVEDKYEILTNGTRKSAKKNSDGTRTEHWEFKIGKGHAPYLFMLAIGEFAVVEDSWNGIPIQYYVEKEYKADAANIFAHTPEMLSFFSDILDYPYPWDKYAQVVVRDYVSGAMENTTASLFGEFVQKHSDELVTSSNDGIVAHEMIHQWFGDLVTCESWSNIVLNEGFANYSEYLWSEYKYGLDAAQILQAGSRSGYYNTAAQSMRAIVDYEYNHREDMFDAQTYNKGGLVLHMLREYLGKDLFYRALNYYLHRNAFSAVEVADLRLAIEKVSGEDMNWFFDQWFFTPGHPILRISDSFDEEGMTVNINVKQEQSPVKSRAIFRMPTQVAVYYSTDEIEFHDIIIDARDQDFSIDVKERPALVVVDPTHSLLAVKRQKRNMQELEVLSLAGLNAQDRIDAFKDLQYEDTQTFRAVREALLTDESWHIRRAALQTLDYSSKYAEAIHKIAMEDKQPEMRILALNKLKKSKDTSYVAMYENTIKTAFPLAEQLEAIEALYTVKPELALSYAEKYREKAKSDMVAASLSSLYAQENDPKYLPFFQEQIRSASGYGIINIMTNYSNLVAASDSSTIIENIDFLAEQFEGQSGSFITQLLLAKGIFDIRNSSGFSLNLDRETKDRINNHVRDTLNSLHENSDDERLKGVLKGFM